MAIATAGTPVSAYRGQTYRLPGLRGGWNASKNVDLVPAESMTEALNLNLHRGGRETRGGTTKVYSDVFPGGAQIMGLGEFRLPSGTRYDMVATADGTIYAQNGATRTVIKTGLATGKVVHFTVFEDTLYICNGANRPQTWDGVAASTSNLANIPSDWSGSNFPKQMVVHGRGAARGLWAYGVPSAPEKIYAAADNGDDFSDANVTTLSIDTGDGFGVVALVEYGERLIAIGKRRGYLIDDNDAVRANWGYSPAQWEGGVASERLVVRTPNDVIVVGEDGEIFSIITTQTTGDYAATSLARPAHIHVWIKDHVDLAQLATAAHAAWDPNLRAVKIFVVRQDQGQVDTALVYFVDRPPEEAWTRHLYAADDFASCSTLVRAAAGDFQVYVGGHDGYVRRLEDPDTALDDGVAYRNGYTTPELGMDDPRALKRFDVGWLVMQRQGGESVAVNLHIDGSAVADVYSLVDESDNPIVDESDNEVIGVVLTDFTVTPSGVGLLSNESFEIGGVGIRLRTDVYGRVDGERFFISQEMIDFTPLGAAAR